MVTVSQSVSEVQALPAPHRAVLSRGARSAADQTAPAVTPSAARLTIPTALLPHRRPRSHANSGQSFPDCSRATPQAVRQAGTVTATGDETTSPGGPLTAVRGMLESFETPISLVSDRKRLAVCRQIVDESEKVA